MRNFAADDAIFYSAGPHGFASCCWHNGVLFAGILDSSDADAWESAAVGTHQLTYPKTTRLVADAEVRIDNELYKVVGVPRQINTLDYLAHLVKQ